MNDKVIGILGSSGRIGSILMQILQEKGYIVKCGYNENSNVKNEKGYFFDIRDEEKLDLFCRDISILVGTAGPSSELSEFMYYAALRKNIYYIDPSGCKLLHFKDNSDAKVILNTGFIPGLLGVILMNFIEKMSDIPDKIEIIHGGEYNFSNSSKKDFIKAKNENFDGYFMKNVKGGKLQYSDQLYPNYTPSELNICKIFPYIINEVEYIGRKYKIKDIYSYTALGENSYKDINFRDLEYVNKGYSVNVSIYINCILDYFSKAAIFSTPNPDYITAYIIYTVIEEILERDLQVVGINRYCDLFYNKGIFDLLNKLPIVSKQINKI